MEGGSKKNILDPISFSNQFVSQKQAALPGRVQDVGRHKPIYPTFLSRLVSRQFDSFWPGFSWMEKLVLARFKPSSEKLCQNKVN
jgi:hypothetical protein